MKARTGKIARLPKAVREQLNQRLADGEQGEALLQWLHSLPEVLEVLVRDFDGRPILKQNLSEWRLGGFRDWEARQERLEQMRALNEEAGDTQDAVPDLTDRMATLLAARFATIFTSTLKVKDWNKPRHRAQLMEMNEAVATLRRFDQGASRLRLEQEQLEIRKAELALEQEARRKRTNEQWRTWARNHHKHLLKTCKSAEELIEATSRFIFGEEDDSSGEKTTPKPEWSEESQKTAANITTMRDQIEAAQADIRFRENQLTVRKVEAVDALQAALHEMLPGNQMRTLDEENDANSQPPASQESQGQSNPVKP